MFLVTIFGVPRVIDTHFKGVASFTWGYVHVNVMCVTTSWVYGGVTIFERPYVFSISVGGPTTGLFNDFGDIGALGYNSACVSINENLRGTWEIVSIFVGVGLFGYKWGVLVVDPGLGSSRALGAIDTSSFTSFGGFIFRFFAVGFFDCVGAPGGIKMMMDI